MDDRSKTREGQVEDTDLHVLKKFPFFLGLEDAYLRKLLDKAFVMQCDANDTVIRQGETALDFFVILNGRVHIGISSDHKFIPIQTLHKGDVLGWSWIAPPHRWRFDAVTLERTRLLMLEGDTIRRLCEEDHDFGYNVLKRLLAILASRLESTRLDLLGHPPTER